MAYLRKHRDGWRAEVERLGVRRSAVWPTKGAAKAWADKVEAEIESGKLAAGKTFKEAVDRYVREVSAKKRGAKQEALRLYATLEHFKLPLAEITATEIAAWRDARLVTVSASSVVREAGTLKNLFRIARKEWRWITSDPWADVKLPKHGPPRHQRWRWQEIARVLRFLGYRHGKAPRTKQQQVALAFMIALRTGMRAGEILQVSPRTLRKSIVTLLRTKTDERPVEVPLTRRGVALCAIVQEWTIDVALLDALFRKARDRSMVGDLHFHDSRGTALTHLARKVDVLTLARISRHKNLKMLSEVYYRETAEEIAKRLR
jgi:integrase